MIKVYKRTSHKKGVTRKSVFVCLLCLIFLGIGVGYASLSTQIGTRGQMIVSSNTTLQKFPSGSTSDFHNERYKPNIITANFVNYVNLDNAISLVNGKGNYWDLSESGNGSVIGWLEVDSSNASKYHLYIGTTNNILYANKDSTNLFDRFYSLEEIHFGNYDTSNVLYMSNMFSSCVNLKKLDLSNFDTSKVITMRQMFQSCEALTSLDISKFNTANVVDMSGMFNGCKVLSSLNLSSFDTSNVTDMYYMFYWCDALTTLDLSNFDTSKVVNMESMFGWCHNLVDLNLSSFNTNRLENSSYMFLDCRSLITIDLSSFDMSKVTNKKSMFTGTTGTVNAYARTTNDANILNSGTDRPTSYRFVVRS